MSIDAEPVETTMMDSEPVEAQVMFDHQLDRPGTVEPVKPAERVMAVDIIRGMALLGILAMNIVSFGWPDSVYNNPLSGGGYTGFNRVIWTFNHLFFEMKMMTLFSMLFGAGLVLMAERADSRKKSLTGVYYRRVAWLLVIGLVHAYFIWVGDILVMYAECGFLLYLFRKFSPKTLIILGLICMFMMVPILSGIGAGLSFVRTNAERAEAEIKAGRTPTAQQERMRQIWKEIGEGIHPSPEKQQKGFDKELRIYRGHYPGIVAHRAKQLLFMQTVGFLLFGIWLAGGRMLLGMGLMKLGVFSGARSTKFYVWLMSLGYGIGLPLMVYDITQLNAHRFDMLYLKFSGGIYYNLYGSVIVALGHVGLLMLIYKAGVLTWLTTRLAAVGRMALSNYLTHSIVCTTLFYGYGFNWFGKLDRTGLALVVLTIWTAQLIYSKIWLEHYRYGPAEWLWRSLTYWKLQPMRKEEALAIPV